MHSGTRGATLLSSDCPQESVRLVQPLLELLVYMNSSLGQNFCQAVHIPWEDMDYDYNHDYYLLTRERDRLGLGDFRISDHPFQR